MSSISLSTKVGYKIESMSIFDSIKNKKLIINPTGDTIDVSKYFSKINTIVKLNNLCREIKAFLDINSITKDVFVVEFKENFDVLNNFSYIITKYFDL